ncbi:SAM-dependent methyltransferase [Streptomyces sp. Ru73]|uniref:class I SAM-dependent methyltransferase n=1 Tax=Streptomyces sp. Ru73 TaxID=2080748 RepID=UPI000CDDD0C8|nr:class I SAM-dependent methyltransferase [Streptomyces sp. Ru73]POX40197.1 SAM-dependent methyltransferase [Streptomyces sp. Ru73]
MTDAHPHHHSHGPGHGHDHDAAHVDWDELAPHLERQAEIATPMYEQAADWLRTLLGATEEHASGTVPVRRIWDVGSGPGVLTCLLARAFPDAEVVAVDPAPALLARARDRAARLGLADRVRTHEAELPGGLDGLGTADLIWTSKVLHHVGDQRAAVALLAGLLRPGGVLAVAEGGLPERVLPRDIGIGRPGLQARLDAAQEEWFARMREALPGHRATAEDWPALLAAAGLRDTGSRSFLLDLPAPLDGTARDHVADRLSRAAERWGELLDESDRAVLARLTDPADEASIAHRPDAFLLTAQTVHAGHAD